MTFCVSCETSPNIVIGNTIISIYKTIQGRFTATEEEDSKYIYSVCVVAI